MPFTREEAERGGWLFHVRFELNDWAEADEEWDLIRGFHLLHNVGDAHAGVRVTVDKEPLEAPADSSATR